MARIRTIKPEFTQSETIGRLTRDARLLFIQLWTVADDEGRLRGHSRILASTLYAYDDDAFALMDGWVEELEKQKCILRYQVEGNTYIQILNWLKHQKIDKPGNSRIPPFDESSRIPATDSRSLATDLVSRTVVSRTEDLGTSISLSVPEAAQPTATAIAREIDKDALKDDGPKPEARTVRNFEADAKAVANELASTSDDPISFWPEHVKMLARHLSAGWTELELTCGFMLFEETLKGTSEKVKAYANLNFSRDADQYAKRAREVNEEQERERAYRAATKEREVAEMVLQ